MQLHLAEYVETLRQLCAIDSESYDKHGLDCMATALAARMERVGIKTTIFEQEKWGNDLLGVVSGTGEARIVLLGHTDTVYPAGTAAARPLRVEGDRAYGPGVSDMKGCLLSAIYAVEALLHLEYRDFAEIRLLCVSDEEIDARHSEALLAQVLQGSDVVLVLENAGEQGNIVSARKGLTRYKLSARGRAAHAGSDFEKGCNAIAELSHQIAQFYRCNGWLEGVTINPGVISGGIAVNVVPDYAEASFDVRFLQRADRLALEERWRELMQKQLVPEVELSLEAISLYKEQPMTVTPESLRLVEAARRIGKLLGIEVDHELRGGGSDSSYASRWGLPVIDGLGPLGGLDHSPDEYLRLDSVAARTALLAGLMLETVADCRSRSRATRAETV